MGKEKQHRQVFKKYQHTKLVKIRDKTKDFGMGLPLKKSNRLKFPKKPHYYILHRVQKLKFEHPFYNLINYDRSKPREKQKSQNDLETQSETSFSHLNDSKLQNQPHECDESHSHLSFRTKQIKKTGKQKKVVKSNPFASTFNSRTKTSTSVDCKDKSVTSEIKHEK